MLEQTTSESIAREKDSLISFTLKSSLQFLLQPVETVGG